MQHDMGSITFPVSSCLRSERKTKANGGLSYRLRGTGVLSLDEVMKKMDSMLTYGPFTNESGEMKYGIMLQIVGCDTLEEAKTFCDHVAVISNKHLGSSLSEYDSSGTPQPQSSGGIH